MEQVGMLGSRLKDFMKRDVSQVQQPPMVSPEAQKNMGSNIFNRLKEQKPYFGQR